MHIRQNTTDVTIYLSVFGELNGEYVESFKRQLEILLAQDFKTVVFDLSHVLVLSNLSVGQLLLFFQELTIRGRCMRIEGISESHFELFKQIHLDKLFPIHRTTQGNKSGSCSA